VKVFFSFELTVAVCLADAAITTGLTAIVLQKIIHDNKYKLIKNLLQPQHQPKTTKIKREDKIFEELKFLQLAVPGERRLILNLILSAFI
jgi:hypothetical protein